jgi:hypothetical protein
MRAYGRKSLGWSFRLSVTLDSLHAPVIAQLDAKALHDMMLNTGRLPGYTVGS